MSFSDINLSVAKDGSEMTISFQYFDDVEGKTFNWQINNQEAGTVEGTKSITVTRSSSPQFFTQGLSITTSISCTSDDTQSDDYYYIYTKTNDSTNTYLEGADKNKSMTIFSNTSDFKSIILPNNITSAGYLYHFKMSDISSTSIFIVPFISGIEYPILEDNVIETDDKFLDFDSKIENVPGRFVIDNGKSLYSYSLFSNGLEWYIVSNYKKTISFTSVATPISYTSLPSIPSAIVYNWNNQTDSSSNIVIPIRNTNSLYYLTIINNNSTPEVPINIYAPLNWSIDNFSPTGGANVKISFSMNSDTYRSILFFYNNTSTTLYIIGFFDGSNLIEPASTLDVPKLLTNSITLVDSSTTKFQIPATVFDSNKLCKVLIVKYLPSHLDKFTLVSDADGTLSSIYLPGTGYVNLVGDIATTYAFAFWILIFNDANGIRRAIIINRYTDT